MRRLLTLAAIVGGCAVLASATGYAAAEACGERVLVDWSDNGRIDSVYRLSCYEDAIAAMPTDIRDYTNAESVIARALSSAVREGAGPPESAGAVAGTSSTGVPLVVLLLVGFAVTLLAAGGAGYLGRRGALGRGDARG